MLMTAGLGIDAVACRAFRDTGARNLTAASNYYHSFVANDNILCVLAPLGTLSCLTLRSAVYHIPVLLLLLTYRSCDVSFK